VGCALKLPELQAGTLIRRYKRFLADIETNAGTCMTVHCPNTGAMTGCAEPGSRAWYSRSSNPKRKYAHTLEIVETADGYVSVNTTRANALVDEGIRNGVIEELAGATEVKAEAGIPDGHGRFDFAMQTPAGATFLEVKSATLLVQGDLGAFPDAQSSRALKHVDALVRRVQAGDRGLLIFCAQHCGIGRVRIAHEIDPVYAEAVAAAMRMGVEVLAYGCETDLRDMQLSRRLPFLSGLPS
jgi:sugar fermentation stimulation protein A